MFSTIVVFVVILVVIGSIFTVAKAAKNSHDSKAENSKLVPSSKIVPANGKQRNKAKSEKDMSNDFTLPVRKWYNIINLVI